MATFGYTVIDKTGKEVKGTIETESLEKAELFPLLFISP